MTVGTCSGAIGITVYGEVTFLLPQALCHLSSLKKHELYLYVNKFLLVKADVNIDVPTFVY